MKIIPLASGSSGNSYLIQTKKDNILIEAGLPSKKLKEGLWDYDVDVANLSLCLASHQHQ